MKDKTQMEKVAILGIGLLGGSLIQALQGKYAVCAWARRTETREWARQHGAEVFDTPEAALAQCDIVVLALPVPQIIEFLPRCAAAMRPGALLTDVGSIKAPVMAEAAKFPQLRFIGSHPMAGTEKSGCEAGFPELYDNADLFLVPGAMPDDEGIETLGKLWKCAGCARIEVLSGAEHDQLVAETSHVLHLLASALSLSILDAPRAPDQRQRFAGCATGFRDTTRIASSNPQMWREIIGGNLPAVLNAVEKFEARFGEMKNALQRGDLDEFERLFGRGKLLRNAWLGYKNPRPARIVLCGIKHCGKSSAGRELATLLNCAFVDSDDVLRAIYAKNHAEKSVREIYRELGEEDFRKLEAQAVREIADRPGAVVTALGGGAVSNPFIDEKTWKDLGILFCIDVPDEVAWKRIASGGIPPFLANFDDPETEFRRRNVARRKEYFCASAAVIVPEAGASPRDAALQILSRLIDGIV